MDGCGMLSPYGRAYVPSSFYAKVRVRVRDSRVHTIRRVVDKQERGGVGDLLT